MFSSVSSFVIQMDSIRSEKPKKSDKHEEGKKKEGKMEGNKGGREHGLYFQ